jgi:hypothetical protein
VNPVDPSLAHPTALELVDAVRDHLTSKVLPTITDPKLRFQTLVAAHVLGVVVREGSLNATMRDEVEAARAALGAYPDDAALYAAVEDGRFDDATARAALHGYLERRAAYALQSWNPAFLWRVTRSE